MQVSGRAEPYWRQVLDYCAEGGLQAVLDEYAHVLRELARLDRRASRTSHVAEIAAEMRRGARHHDVSCGSMTCAGGGAEQSSPASSMRARFAAPLRRKRPVGGRREPSPAPSRSGRRSTRRSGPSSSRRPRSGQEGLDFHPYCHAIVHWNLPANPVDLEQREGRVHRYKGHAVRKNSALLRCCPPGDTATSTLGRLFERGSGDRATGQSDLVPFWVFSTGGRRGHRAPRSSPAAQPGQRAAGALRKSLAVYRMVFGQARQEELLAYLLDRVPDADRLRLAEDLRIDLSPPTA